MANEKEARSEDWSADMPLSREHAYLWWLDLATLQKEDLPVLTQLLSDAEITRMARFQFEGDQKVYAAAHAIARALLTRVTGDAPHSFRFRIEDHGKPELICRKGDPRIRVNISHTRDLAAVALTVENDIGVDVEWLKREPAVDDLAKRMFAEIECAHVHGCKPNEKISTFLDYWTLKEAYVKAIGKGLSAPLDAFSFDLKRLSIRFSSAVDEQADHWRFWRYHPGADHVAALAIKHPKPKDIDARAGAAPLDYLRRINRVSFG